MTTKVGFIVLEAVLAPICEPQEPVYSKLLKVNGEDENQMRAVIREFIKPYYDSFDKKSREVIADTILYLSLEKKIPNNVSFDSLPTPFDLTHEMSKFCTWLTKELMIEKEDFNLAQCEYTDDLSLVHRLRRTNYLTV